MPDVTRKYFYRIVDLHGPEERVEFTCSDRPGAAWLAEALAEAAAEHFHNQGTAGNVNGPWTSSCSAARGNLWGYGPYGETLRRYSARSLWNRETGAIHEAKR